MIGIRSKLALKFMKMPWLVVFLLFSVHIFSAQTPAPSAPPRKPVTTSKTAAEGALPTTDDIETAMKRTFGYDASITWVIHDIRPAAISGVADVLVSINKQAPQHIYLSSNTQNAIIGEMIPFGPDPFAPIRTKLRAADGPAIVHQDPAISMVEFSDLECPHCKSAQPIVEKLANDFPQVRYVFQEFPLPASLHPWALKGAEYADCVARLNPPLFWKYIGAVFENQGGIAAVTADDKLKEAATSVGLDASKISTCASLPQTEASVNKSVELGKSLDVTQTPTLFVNGRRVLGIADIPYEQLKKLVQFEIDHAGK
jgi:protein-disulfide isomerase